MGDQLYFENVRYISAADAAGISGVTRDHIARLARAGKIRSRRVGKNWYVDEDSLKSFLVTKEYHDAKRRENLSKERRDAYKDARTKKAWDASKEISQIKHVGAQLLASQKVAFNTKSLSIKKALQKAAQKGVQSFEPRRHVAPMYAIHPTLDFLHKASALITAFMLVFGTYAFADRETAREVFASVGETTSSARAILARARSAGMPELSDVTGALAFAAGSPVVAAAASREALTAGVASSVESLALKWRRTVDEFVFGAMFDQFGISSNRGVVFVSVTAVTPAPKAAAPKQAVTTPRVPQKVTQNIINQPVVERIRETQRVSVVGGITEEFLNAKLDEIRNDYTQRILATGSANSTFTTQVYQTVSHTNKIDQLGSVTIESSTWSGGTITGATITGGSVTATSFSGVLAIGSGGTGTSTAPSYGNVLLGNSSGGYDLVATSSLGIVGGGGGSSFGQAFEISGGFLAPTTSIRLSLGQASSTLFTANRAYFGLTATSTFGTDGALSLAGSLTLAGSLNGPLHANAGVVAATTSIGVLYGGTGATTASGARTNLGAAASGANSDITSLSGLTTALTVPQGGTGWGAIAANSIVLGNGTGALATTSAGTNGHVLALVSGVPTWVATTTLSNISGTLGVASGGTGATTFSYGLVLSPGGTSALTNIATSSLGLLTTNVAEGSNQYYTDARVQAFVHGSTTIPKTYTSNTFTGAQTFSGGVTIGSLNGPLHSNAGVVAATSTIGVRYGGTGLTSDPSYGNILVGNASGGYTLTATSSLGLASLASFSASSPLSYNSGTGAFSIQVANGSQNGYLTSTDWTTFNEKVSSSSLSTFVATNKDWNITAGALAPTTTLGILVSASSTIGNGTQAGGLTIAGGATTTGYLTVQSTATSTFAGGVQTTALNVTSTSASSTFTNGILLSGGCFATAGGCITAITSSSIEDLNDVAAMTENYGDLLFWNGTAWADIATSSLNISTSNLVEGSNLFYTDARVNAYIHGSTTIPKTYTANTFTGANTFNSTLTVGSLNGPLHANAGVVAATSTIGVRYGGTGLTSDPSYGNILVGNASGGYTLTATSSLGLASASSIFGKSWEISNGQLAPTTTTYIVNIQQASSTIFSALQAKFGATASSTFGTDGALSMGGHLTFGTDNTYDIGANSATRPRNVYVAGATTIGGQTTAGSFLTTTGDYVAAASRYVYWTGRSALSSASDGVLLISNNAVSDFGRLQLGGTTSAFPAVGRSGSNLVVQSADGGFSSNLSVGTSTSYASTTIWGGSVGRIFDVVTSASTSALSVSATGFATTTVSGLTISGSATTTSNVGILLSGGCFATAGGCVKSTLDSSIEDLNDVAAMTENYGDLLYWNGTAWADIATSSLDLDATGLASADFGDWTCNGTTCTVDANAIALTTDTTGNYVETVASSGSITVGGSGAEDADVTVNLNMGNANTWTALQTFANASSTLFSSTYASSTNLLAGSFTLGTLNGPLHANAGVVSATSSILAIYGGTGQTTYTTGDILYASSANTLAKLPVGSSGTVLKVSGGIPTWGADITSGGGGGATAFSTTTDSLAIYPTDTSDVLIIGASATSTASSILEVFGKSYFSNNVGIGSTSPLYKLSVEGSSSLGNEARAGYFTATTSVASTFPYASTTAITVSGLASTSQLVASNSFTFKDVTGFLKATAGVVATAAINLASDITGILGVSNGGTGWGAIAANSIVLGNGTGAVATTSAGTNGQVLALVSGVPTWVATTTLANISGTLGVASGGTGQTTLTSGSLLYGAGTAAVQSVATSSVTAGTGISFSGTAGYLVGGTSLTINTPWTTSGNNIHNNNSANLGIGTSTPYAKATVWGGTTGKIFEAVTNASSSALSVSAEGFGTTTVSGLNISGSATSTSNVGFNITTGCYAVSGTCVGASIGAFSIEDLSDVAAMTENYGDLLYWNGTTWTDVATSSLAIAISDTTGTLAVARGGTGATTLNDLITLGTHTTGNYVATLADSGAGTLTIANSGTENAGVTATINLANANTWTGKQNFYGTASSTLFSAHQAFFGATATSSFSAAGVLTLATDLAVTEGGTGASTLTGILKGNGTSAFTAVTGTDNYIPKWSSNSFTGTSLLYDTGTNVGIGTTTPYAKTTIWGDTAGKIFEVATNASSSALSVSATGFGTTTLSGLTISGSATTTSNVGILLSGGCFATAGGCVKSTLDSSIEDLNDVAAMTENYGDLLYWNGTAWADIATSSLDLDATGLAAADFGDWTCNGTTCTVDADAVALGTDTTGNYVATITGTANQITVAGSGSENAGVTLSLPSQLALTAASTTLLSVLDTIYVGRSSTTTISSSAVNLPTGGEFQINGTSVLSGNTLGTGVLTSSLTTVGALNSGSITSGFGAINIGADALTAGAASVTSLTTTGAASIGTSTPYAVATIWGTSAGKILEVATNASSTALSVSATGFGTTTLSGLNISGSATSTSNVGFNITTGCYAVSGTCVGSSIGAFSIEDLSDVAAMTENYGDLLFWNGSTWTDLATSSLGIAISDTTGTLAVARGGTGATSLNDLITLGTHTTGNYLATLSSSGSLTIANSGSETAAVTANLNMGNANTWTALQTFTNASTTALSCLGNCAFGSSATSSFSTAGALTLAVDLAVTEGGTGASTAASARSNLGAAASGANSDITSISGLTTALSVPQGGTGWAAIQSGAIPYGNGSSALATTTAGTAGHVLALLNGVPTWVATTTFSTGLTYSAGSVTVNTTQNIAKLSNLTSNGFVKTSGGDGTLSVDTNTYLTSAITAIGPTGQTSDGPTVTFATSSSATNGLTPSLVITGSGDTQTFTSSISGTLTVGGGGTGATTLTSGQLVYGAGTGAVQTVATSSVTAGTGVSFSGTAGALVGGTSLTINTPWTSTGNNISNNNSANVGIGTSTPNSKLTAWGGTTGNIFEAVTNASSTALKVSAEGFGTTTVSGLTISGSATTTSNVGILLSGGCFATAGGCVKSTLDSSIEDLNDVAAMTENYGDLLFWNGTTWTDVATSSLDLDATGLASADFGDWTCNGTTCTVDADAIALATDTTGNYVATLSSSGSITVGSSGSENAAVTANLNMGNANTWTALQTFANASTTALSCLGNCAFGSSATSSFSTAGVLTLTTLNGPLHANAGVVAATSTIGVRYGGTGLTSDPSYGQILVGQTNGTYALTATSSLGLLGTSQKDWNVVSGYLAPTTTLGIIVSASSTIGAGTQTTGLTIAGGATTTLDLTVSGGDILLGTTNIFSGGDTASLNNIDAIDATTETTFEAAIDALANLVTTGALNSGSITSGFGSIDIGADALTAGAGSLSSLTVTGHSAFTTASTTRISCLGNCAFGATATSSFSSAGVLTLTSALAVTSGGTGATSLNDLITLGTHTTGNYLATASSPNSTLSVGGSGSETAALTVDLNLATANTWTGKQNFYGTASSTLFSAHYLKVGASASTTLDGLGNVTVGNDLAVTGQTTLATSLSGLLKATSGVVSAASAGTDYVSGSSGSANRVAYWTSASNISSDADLAFDGTTLTARDLLVQHTAPILSINDSDSSGTDFRIDVNDGGAVFAADIAAGLSGEYFAFSTNNAEKLRLTEAGNFGIGTTSPYSMLSVAGQIVGQNFVATSTTAASSIAYRLGIANTAPSYSLDVAGFINTDQFSGYKQAGNTILYASSTNSSTLVGQNAGAALKADGTLNTALGYQALLNATSSTGIVAIGPNALLGSASAGTVYSNNIAIGSSAQFSNLSGSNNIAIGSNALYYNKVGASNTAIGNASQMGSSGNSAYYNTSVGASTLAALTTGQYNSAFGNSSLTSLTSGSQNSGFGPSTLGSLTTGDNNLALGYNALATATTSSNQVAIGYGALDSMITGPSNDTEGNVAIGYQAGTALTYGGANILLGYQAGDALTTGSNNIVLGYDVDAPSATASNQLNIGNILFGSNVNSTGTTVDTDALIGIGTNAPTFSLDVTGNARFTSLVDASHFVATSTSATSTFAGGLAIETSGLVYDFSTNRVGIGTASPDNPLTVIGNTRVSGNVFVNYDGSSNASITQIDKSGASNASRIVQYDGSGNVQNILNANGASYFNNGNLGVGTTTPWGKLSVTNTGSGPSFVVEDDTSPDSTPFIIDASGNVGIGTASPGSLLHLSSSGATTLTINAGAASASKIDFKQLGTSYGVVEFDGNDFNVGNLYVNGATTFKAGNAERMRITSGGLVGIGTTSPSTLLSLAGTSGFFASTTATSTFQGGGINLLTAGGNTGCFAINGSCLPTTNASSTLLTDNNRWTGGNIFAASTTIGAGGQTTGLTISGGATTTGNAYFSGNVGIGTVAAATILEVSKSSSSGSFGVYPSLTLTNANTSGSAYTNLVLRSGTVSGSGVTGAVGFLESLATNNASQNLSLYTADETYPLNLGSGGTDMTILGARTGFNDVGPDYRTEIAGSSGSGYFGITSSSDGDIFEIDGSGNVGINTASPSYKLDVAGFINTDQFSGYKQAGNTILYASTTNFAVSVGPSAGAGFNSTSTALRSTAIGYQALATTPTNGNTTDNTAVGYNALTANTSGNSSTAVGTNALAGNTTGSGNTAVGLRALLGNTTGSSNTAFGLGALQVATTSSNHTAIGYTALQSMITGSSNDTEGNVALGYNAGTALTYGGANILLGYQAGDALTTGSNNIVLGYDIDAPSATGNNQLTLGNLIFGTGLDGTGTTVSSGKIGIGTSTPQARLSVQDNTAEQFRLANDSTNFAKFGVGADGNLTISGTTTSASALTATLDAPFRQLNAGTIPVNIGGSGTGYPGIGYNVNFATAGNTYTYRGGDTAALITLGSNTGDRIGFNVAAAGSAGNAITFTEALTVKATGVGVLDTTPSYPLDVTGAGRFTSLVDASHFVATSTTATSTFAGGLTVDGTDFVVDPDSGNVGIGTAAPLSIASTARVLEVSGSNYGVIYAVAGGSDRAMMYADDANNSAVFGARTNSSVQFHLNDAEVGRFSTAGNFGIATTTPWGKLSVTNTGSGPSFVVEDDTSPDSTPFLISASGDVGIGTASPETKLHLSGGNILLSNNRQYQQELVNGTNVRLFGIDDGDNFNIGDQSLTAGAAMQITLANTGSFKILDNDATTVRFLLDETTGKIGIGTTSPSTLLSLAGTTGILASTTATSTFQGGGINLLTAAGNTGCYSINGTCLPLFSDITGSTYRDWSVQGNGYLAPTTTRGILVNASSTIGAGGQTTGLTISGGATTTGHLTLSGTAANILLGSNYLSGDGGDEGVFVDSSGNAAIGTNVPFNVNGNTFSGTGLQATGVHARLILDGSATAGIWFNDSSHTSGQRMWHAGVDDGTYFISTASDAGGSLSQKFTILNGGNIGIGTSTPYAKVTTWGGTTGKIFEAVTNASSSALSVSAEGFGTTTLSGLNISASATTTSNVGILLSGGCFATAGGCVKSTLDSSIEDLNDVAAMTENYGDLLFWNGTAWADIATSSLNLSVSALASADFGDWTCNGSACTVDANAIALTTDTTGNYVETVSSSGSITVSGSGAEDADVTVNLNMGNANTWTAQQNFYGTASSTLLSANWFKAGMTASTTIDAGGDLTVGGGEISLGSSLILSGGDTTSLNLIDAIDATTETTLEAAIDALANLVTTGALNSGSITSGFGSIDIGSDSITSGSLLASSNDVGALGASGTAWSDLFLASGGVINFNAGDVTLTHGSNVLTLGGGDLALGANNLTLSGLITSTATAANTFPYASTTMITATTASSTNLIVSSTGSTGTTCLQASSAGVISSTGSACGSGGGSDPFTHPAAGQSATTSHMLFNGNASSTVASAHWLKVGMSASTTIDTGGDLTVGGGDITLGTQSIFSGGDTASLNNVDAIDDTTEATLESEIDALANLVTTGALNSGSITSGFGAIDIGADALTAGAGSLSSLTVSGNSSLANATSSARIFANEIAGNVAAFGASATSSFSSAGVLTLATDLAVTEGGTGASTLTGLLQGNGTGAFTGITNSSTVGQILRTTGASTYAWGALDLDDGDAITGTIADASVEDAITVSGGTIGANNISGTQTTTGTLTLGDGGDRIDIASDSWDVTNGAISGVTTLGLSGIITSTANTANVLPYASTTMITATTASTTNLIVSSTGGSGTRCLQVGADGTVSAAAGACGVAGAGVSQVGSMTSATVFGDSTADDDWLGLGDSAGRIAFDDQSTDFVNVLSARLGVGTTSPWGLLSVNPDALGSGVPEFVVGSSTATHFLIDGAGNVGIGTTTPGSKFAIQSIANFTTATTTYLGTGGINLTGGCFAINGACIGYTVKLAEIYATSTVKSNVVVGATSTPNAAAVISYTSGLPSHVNFRSNISSMVVEVWGSGGGGGGATLTTVPFPGGGGGGAGGYSKEVITSPSGAYYYTVQAGGGGGSGSSDGTAGSQSCFGTNSTACTSPSVQANGGSGGAGTAAASSGAGGSGAATGSAGSVKMAGGDGTAGNSTDGNQRGGGGHGGTSPGGGGGGKGGRTAQSDSGNTGAIFGGGGGGGSSGGSGGSGGAGGIVITVYATSSPTAAGNDYAEMFPVSSPDIGAGDIVAVDVGVPVSMKLATKGDGSPLAGVIATAPGQLLGDINAQGQRPVALAGRVPVKFSSEKGDVKIGDRIMPSSQPGIGMKAGPFDDSVGIVIDAVQDNKVMIFLDMHQGIDINAIGMGLLDIDPTSFTNFENATTTSTGLGGSPAKFNFVDSLMSILVGNLTNKENASSSEATTTAATSTASIFWDGLYSRVGEKFGLTISTSTATSTLSLLSAASSEGRATSTINFDSYMTLSALDAATSSLASFFNAELASTTNSLSTSFEASLAAAIAERASSTESAIAHATTTLFSLMRSEISSATSSLNLSQFAKLSDLWLPSGLRSASSTDIAVLSATTSAMELVGGGDAEGDTSPEGEESPSATTTPWVASFADASQALKDGISSLADTVIHVFAKAFYATVGIFEKVFAKEVHTDTLCVSDDTGETCITKAQLDALLAGAAAATQQEPVTNNQDTSASTITNDQETITNGNSNSNDQETGTTTPATTEEAPIENPPAENAAEETTVDETPVEEVQTGEPVAAADAPEEPASEPDSTPLTDSGQDTSPQATPLE